MECDLSAERRQAPDVEAAAPRRDARIVASFQRGLDRERSFELLVERYYRRVRGYFGHRIFSAEDCEDLTQNVFRSVYQGLDTFRAEARFRTWLFQIVHNTYRTWQRGRMTAEEHGHEAAARIPRPQTPAFEDHRPVGVDLETPLAATLERERLELLRQAVSELPRKMQECIRLRVYHDCSYKEIAAFMDLSIETVKAHLFKARGKLRKTLQSSFGNVDF